MQVHIHPQKVLEMINMIRSHNSKNYPYLCAALFLIELQTSDETYDIYNHYSIPFFGVNGHQPLPERGNELQNNNFYRRKFKIETTDILHDIYKSDNIDVKEK